MEPQLIEKLIALAAPQYGLFSVRQADAIGVTRSMLRMAVARGWICDVRRGIYAVAVTPRSPWRDTYAAAMAAGPRAAISHTPAASIHRLYGVAPGEIELSVPWSVHRRLEGVRVHRSRTLSPADLEVRHGVAVTTPVRTLIDLADRFHDPLLGLMVDEGAVAGLWTPEGVKARLDQLDRGVPGLADLRRVLSGRLGEGRPDSRLEQRVIRIVKRHFPGYCVHYERVFDGTVIVMDIAWPALKIDGEVDGMASRTRSRTKFERVERRANILQAHGWRIIHFTARMSDQEIVAQLAPFFRA